MIDPNELSRLKEEYGELFEIGDYIVRKLTLGEFKAIEALDPVDAEDRIVDTAVLWPKNLDYIPAGHISSLANSVIRVSDFTNPAEVLDISRAKAKQIRNMMYAFVLATQDKYTEDDLDQLTFSELADKVALSENIIEIQKAIYDPSVSMRLVIGSEEEEEEGPSRTDMSEEEWERINQGKYHNPETKTTAGAATYDDPIAQKLKAAMG